MITAFKSNRFVFIVLVLLSLFLFTRSLGVHGIEYRDDEIFYYNSTTEMLAQDEYLSPVYFGENRFQKPILFYWFILICYKIFGANWAAARLTSAVFAALTVGFTWLLAKRHFGKRIALLSSFILMTTVMFFRHAKNVVPDMALNFFIVIACMLVYEYFVLTKNAGDDQKKRRVSVLFFFSCALGFMIKGFAALIVPILTLIVFALLAKKPRLIGQFGFGKGILIFLAISLPWFIYMIARHGGTYIEYMLVDETKNRLLAQNQGGFMAYTVKSFFDHMLFYTRTILSYFAPWSVFGLAAVVFSLARLNKEEERREPLLFLLTWFFVVYFFFSFMNFTINHYMLVLTTPFAILTSYFFLYETKTHHLGAKFLNGFRKYFPIVFMLVGAFAFSFLALFMAKANGWLVAGFLCVVAVAVWQCAVNRNRLTAPLFLAIFLFVVFCQTPLMNRANVTPHETLQGFAQSIKRDADAQTVISVGSRDIHEKEFQIYITQKIDKTVGWNDELTKEKLDKLFAENSDVYCLVTGKDYKTFFGDYAPEEIEVVQQDFMIRKRMYIDKEFFWALLKFDQETVYDYLMEKIILIRKRNYV